MMRTKGRILGTMFILSYPFISIGLATLSFASGEFGHITSALLGIVTLTGRRVSALLITASRSEITVLRYGCYTMLVGPLSCAFLFVWIAKK
jgi:hypothetical protein